MQSILTTVRSVIGGASEDPSESNTNAAGTEGERIIVHGPEEPYIQQQLEERQRQEEQHQAQQQQQQQLQQERAQQEERAQQQQQQQQQRDTPKAASSKHPSKSTFMKTPQQLADRSTWNHHVDSLKEQVDKILSSTVQPLQTSWNTLVETDSLKRPDRYISAIGPAIMAMFAAKDGLSFLTVYALALLGSSVGFHLFLYFISIGYALGIALPLTAALYKYLTMTTRTTRSTVVAAHTVLVLAWAVRSVIFFLWREHVNWPALHDKIVQVNETKAPSLNIKILCWLVYSFLYVCMLSPCWFRINTMLQRNGNSSTRFMGVALALQTTGFLLETVADWQKSTFKVSEPARRYEWCHTGVWKYSTHPNYAGEWLFWLGTTVGGLSAISHPVQGLLMAAGFFFITTVLRGAVQSLGSKHWEKYGNNPEFRDFQRRHGVMGPKLSSILAERRSSKLAASEEAQITLQSESSSPVVQDEELEAGTQRATGTNL
jgi:steroid 5-alpha reductase family enzyme